ncbi:MAG: ankyrin repeat domain-containing protein, partial [Streptomycetaceae bacterium]|nr:ankyrin repeat domain-containing protein [Streptomycetaceae bacterium]
MATVRLPDDPDFEQLRKQAKDLRNQARSGDSEALALVGAHHPGGPHPPSLAGAQLVIARRHGFPSWAALKRHIRTIRHYRRVPDQVEAAASRADEFLLLACLRYGHDDRPARWKRAADLLAAHP